MVFWCCDPLEPLSPEETASPTGKVASEIVADTTTDPENAGPDSADALVSVIVPVGVHAGDEITVQSPDGKRTVNVSVPQGLKEGDSFMVSLPPAQEFRSETQGKSFEEVLDDFLLPTPERKEMTTVTGYRNPPTEAQETREGGEGVGEMYQQQSRSFVDVIEDMITPNPDPVPGEIQTREGAALPEEISATENPTRTDNMQHHVDFLDDDEALNLEDDNGDKVTYQAEEGDTEEDVMSIVKQKQRLLLVRVPPGMMPGSTIHVEIPGEDRTLAAQVPPNAHEFHVAYTPRGTRMQHQNRAFVHPELPAISSMPPAQATSQLVEENFTKSGQKLLLVRVPPGTPPDAMLHVSVPDEPGRILAARVPPGNVKEFHVSYEARAMSAAGPRSMLPPANPYAQGGSYPPHFYPYAAPMHIVHRPSMDGSGAYYGPYNP